MFGASDKDHLDYNMYEKSMIELGTKLDNKVWAVSASHLFAGVSIG